MVCYHEIIHEDGGQMANYREPRFLLVHSEDFEFYEEAGTVKDLVPIGHKIIQTKQYCSEDLLQLMEENYREIQL